MNPQTKWTVEDYHRMIGAGILGDRRVELLEGEIVEMSPEGPLHRYHVDEIARYLRGILSDRAKVFEAHPITLPTSEPEPDIAIVENLQERYLTHHPYPRNIYWLIEVSDSTITYDLEVKKRTYARAAIKEYWIVDLSFQKVIVFRQPFGNEYQVREEFRSETIAPQVFRDVQINIRQLLEVRR